MSLLPLILGLLAAFAPLAIDMYLPALPEMAMALGSDSGGAQLTIASYFVGMGLGQLIYGPLTDRFGRRPPLFVGVGLFLLASLACALAQTLPQMVALRFVQALGGCAGMVVARAVVRDVAHLRDPVRLMGRLMLIMGVAPILAPFMGGLLSAWQGWRAIFIFLALFAAAALLLVALLLPETHAPERRLRQRPRAIMAAYAALLADGRFLRPALAAGCAIAGMFAYIAGSPAVFMEVHGIAPGQYGIWFGINAAGIIAGSQLSGWLAERWGREVLFTRMLRAMAVAALGLVMATWLGQGFAVIFLCLFAYIAMLGVVLPLGTVLGMAHFAALAGTASALLGTLQFGLGGLAGAVLGVWHDASGLPMAVVILGCSVMANLAWRR